MTSSRDAILRKLRAAQTPFTDVPPITEPRHTVPLADTSPSALRERFVQEAQVLGCTVYQPESDTVAVGMICDIINTESQVLSWDAAHIPLPGIHDALRTADIQIAAPGDSHVRVGITGADAALAATGSLLLISGTGKYRATSLLPDIHIAVLRSSLIIPDLETWFAHQKEKGLDVFRQASNIVIVSGPSKTADIAQELIKGAHGPRELHIVLLGDESRAGLGEQ
jgi:L-lactate dehydrogenase complex protein LldG